MTNFPTMYPIQLPDARINDEGVPLKVQPYTVANLTAILTTMSIRPRFNEMSHLMELHCDGYGTGDADQMELRAQIADTQTRLGIPRLINDVNEDLKLKALRDRYHPMEDWIASAKWDGVDRFEAVVNAVPTTTKLWPTYLRKWMVEVVQAACGWRDDPVSLPNVLVFVGKQGRGKSRFFNALLGKWCLGDAPLALNTGQGKDNQLAVLSYPVAELAEIDSTFRASDVGALKSFLSRTDDVLRLPYARTALKRRRATVFGGSVNDWEFLVDETGSRRFWPVEVFGDIEPELCDDLQQLWAQAFAWWENGESWFLNDEEDKARAEDAGQYAFLSTGLERVVDFYAEHRGGPTAAMNFTDILARCEVPRTDRKESKAIRQWLIDQLGRHKTLDHKQRSWMFPTGALVQVLSVVPKAGKGDQQT